jgi:hypothetical protein
MIPLDQPGAHSVLRASKTATIFSGAHTMIAFNDNLLSCLQSGHDVNPSKPTPFYWHYSCKGLMFGFAIIQHLSWKIICGHTIGWYVNNPLSVGGNFSMAAGLANGQHYILTQCLNL